MYKTIFLFRIYSLKINKDYNPLIVFEAFKVYFLHDLMKSGFIEFVIVRFPLY